MLNLSIIATFSFTCLFGFFFKTGLNRLKVWPSGFDSESKYPVETYKEQIPTLSMTDKKRIDFDQHRIFKTIAWCFEVLRTYLHEDIKTSLIFYLIQGKII